VKQAGKGHKENWDEWEVGGGVWPVWWLGGRSGGFCPCLGLKGTDKTKRVAKAG